VRSACRTGFVVAHLLEGLGTALSCSLLFCGVVLSLTQVWMSTLGASTRMFSSFPRIARSKRSSRRHIRIKRRSAREACVRARTEGRSTCRYRRRPLSLLVSLHGRVRKTPVAAQINRPWSGGAARARARRGFFEIE